MRIRSLLAPAGLGAAALPAALAAAPSAVGRRPGTTTWRNFRTNTTSATGLFNPSQAGTYQIRARTSNIRAGKESGWSPVISEQIS